MNKFVYPVIHHLNAKLTLEQATICHQAGADGVFLISHENKDNELPELGIEIKETLKMKVGLNLLATPAVQSFDIVQKSKLDMLWLDNAGVSSEGLSPLGMLLKDLVNYKKLELFASVAFKYQKYESNPKEAAYLALKSGFIPVTSGSATGVSPAVEKIKEMSEAVGGNLGVASGMNLENIDNYKKYLKYILVATGVSVDEHHFDYELLKAFIIKVKST